MELCGEELDRIVLEIVREHNAGGAPPTREQVAQAVLDYIRPRIEDYVMPSLERLLLAGVIDEDRDATRGRPYIYQMTKDNSADCPAGLRAKSAPPTT